MSVAAYISRYWGKAIHQEDGTLLAHPLAYHMLDVAAVSALLLQTRPLMRHRFVSLCGIAEPDLLRLFPLVIALHDLGKFSAAFQSKVPELWQADAADIPSRAHTNDGWLFWAGARGWEDGFCHEATPRIWPQGQQNLDILMRLSLGHHGRPLSNQPEEAAPQAVWGKTRGDACACAHDMISLFLPQPLQCAPCKSKLIERMGFVFAGFVSLSDWVGSNRRWFDHDAPDLDLADYYDLATQAAEKAVRETGLAETPVAAEKDFQQLCHIENPYPMQQWAKTVPLADGPALYMIEDVTGAGKTEAAQMLVHRLMAAGRASGAYWAMPTGATANAMFLRQEDMIRGLYDGGTKPHLVLAHGQAKLSEDFGRLLRNPALDVDVVSEEGLSAAASCTAFLAHDRRVSLMADVGAGTVDQAILSVLPVRYNTMRLFGLAGKVLLFDEAHAYDAYMGAEIEQLLEFQAAFGGCAIILSATLPQSVRQKFIKAWRRGAGVKSPLALTEKPPYPLATVVSDHVQENAVAAAERSHRHVPVRLVHDAAEVFDRLVSASAAGAACVWIRNTVDDVLAAAVELRARGLEPMVFHARFAQCDRQAREKEVLRIFGKESDSFRHGRVLVASQVVEQSLDLDFDVLISDLAPVDLLIQRAGRLYRHKRARPAGISCEMWVLSPPAVADPAADWIRGFLPGTSAVYRKTNILWRTARILAEKQDIATPEGLRDLVEYAYDAAAPVPAGILRASDEAEGEEKANRTIGQQNVLKLKDGYSSVTQWEDERAVSTRLGMEQVTVRFGRLAEDGTVQPYADDDTPLRAWALSEIRVRPRLVPPDAVPPAELATAVRAAKTGWGRYEQDMPLIVLLPEGTGWRGEFVRGGKVQVLSYDAVNGLRLSA